MLQYKGLRATMERLIVSEEQVDRQIDRLLEQRARTIPVTGRPSQPDDELVLDYAGTVDGVPFEGGAAQNQTLTLGSGMFIPGFEEQLIGRRAGEDVAVRVTFPARYHAPELANREAVFQCHIREIRLRRKYAPDDVFAREVGGCESYAAFRRQLWDGMQAYADRQAEEDLKARLLDALAEGLDDDVTEAQLARAVEAEMQSLKAQLARQGLTLDAYCQFTGQTEDQLREASRPDARRAVARQRAVAEIAREEGIEADEASVAEAIRRACRENNMTPDELAARMDEEAQSAIVRNVIADRVMDRVRELADIAVVERQS